jgi:hypothetical protein
MTRADLFATAMCKELKEFGGKWDRPKPQKAQHECVDIEGEIDGRKVLIEVELRRIAPLANMVKIWSAISKEADKNKYKNAIVFQAFSAFYPKNGTQRTNAEFVGEAMAKACGIEYIPRSMEYKPAKRTASAPVMKGAGRCCFHARKLAAEVIRILKAKRRRKR